MPRQPRIQFAGAFYHVMARGDRREAIFLCGADYRLFLKTMSDVCQKTGWRMHAWTLMGNHYVLQTPQANLVAGMSWFQNTYTRRFNCRHGLWEHLFGSRYKAVVWSRIPNGVAAIICVRFSTTCHPVRAGLVGPERGLGILEYRWTSLSMGYAVPPGRRAPWLAGSRHRICLGGETDAPSGRRRFVQRLELRALEEQKECRARVASGDSPLRSTLRRGWFWGSQAFGEHLLKSRSRADFSNPNYRSSQQAADHTDACRHERAGHRPAAGA
jgi:putative transposase